MKPIYLLIATLAAVLAVVVNSAQFKKECDGRSMRECVDELIDWTTGRTSNATNQAPAPSVDDNGAQAGSGVAPGTNWDAAPADGDIAVPDGSNGYEAPASDPGIQSGDIQSGGNKWDTAPSNESPQN